MKRERFHWLRSIARVIVVWVSEAAGLLLMTHIVPGLRVDGWAAACMAVLVIASLNAVLWPFLSRIALPFLVFTFGVGALILNGFLCLSIATNTVPTGANPGCNPYG